MIFIPAKYASTRLPQKNFRAFFYNLSLLQIAVLRAINAKCGIVVVSSEETQQVLSQVKALGLRFNDDLVLHNRPEHLARDPATIYQVLEDYVKNMNTSHDEKIGVVLPTSPFNDAENIRKAVEVFDADRYEKLMSVTESAKPPFNSWSLTSNGCANRELVPTFPDNKYQSTQSTRCPPTFMSNGCVAVYSKNQLLSRRGRSRVQPFLMQGLSGLDIDRDYEFSLAKTYFPIWNREAFINSAVKV